jgi:parallel beta-helix repeat protein
MRKLCYVIPFFSLLAANCYAADRLVSNASELMSAVPNLRAGDRLLLAPGTYVLTNRLAFTTTNSGSAGSPITIMPQQEAGTVTLNANCHESALWFAGGKYTVVKGLRITNGAYHAIKIDGGSSNITVENSVLFENTCARSTDPNSQFSAIKGGTFGAPYPSNVVVQNNEIYESPLFGGPNLQGIDCNACKNWVVRGNHIHHITSTNASPSGTCVQFKSGSENTIIENNIIHHCGLIGINYGGFGNPAWGGQSFEHIGGRIQNNIVYNCVDAGISVVKNQNGRIFHNTLYNNGYTPDVRISASGVEYRNNILDRALRLRDGTTVIQSNNLVLTSPSDGSLFINPAASNFRLKSTAVQAIDQGPSLPDVTTDFEGDPRPSGAAPDLGADEVPLADVTPPEPPTNLRIE